MIGTIVIYIAEYIQFVAISINNSYYVLLGVYWCLFLVSRMMTIKQLVTYFTENPDGFLTGVAIGFLFGIKCSKLSMLPCRKESKFDYFFTDSIIQYFTNSIYNKTICFLMQNKLHNVCNKVSIHKTVNSWRMYPSA